MLPLPKQFDISAKQASPSLSFRVGDCNLEHLHKRYTPWSVFQDGRMNSIYTQVQPNRPQQCQVFGDHASNHTPTTMTIGCNDCEEPRYWAYIKYSSNKVSSAQCLDSKQDKYVCTPQPTEFIPSFRQFQILLTLFSKSFSHFPRGTCALSVSYVYLALEGIYLPLRLHSQAIRLSENGPYEANSKS